MTPSIDTTAVADPLTERVRATWTSGDFGRIAKGYEQGAAEFIARLGLTPGERVLDVACGTGNLSLPAARTGALVTGIDIAPNLIAQADENAARERLPISFEVGDAERLPYAAGAFATVVTMFGAMFAARPGQAAAELLRVTRRGGRIAMASWTPTGFIGDMLRATVRHVPAPPGIPSPLLWGT
jgi:ubiquinone/menaquinone biosynthesis C-methylase UbiE